MKKTKSSSIISKLAVCGIALSAWVVNSVNASADDLIFDLTPFAGAMDASVTVTVSQVDNDTFNFFVDQTTSVVGDLRGIFFQINESLGIAASDLSFSNFVASPAGATNFKCDPDMAWKFDLNLVRALTENSRKCPSSSDITEITTASAGNNNVKGGKKRYYDIGFEFGTGGKKPDKIQSVSFDLDFAFDVNLYSFMPVHMKHFIAARVMSLPGRPRSSKLDCCGQIQVPEPSSTMGLLTFAIGGLLLWRRKAA